MPKLSQVLAVGKTYRPMAEEKFTQIYHNIQRGPTRLTGIARTYTPKDEDGDALPPESTLVQLKVDSALEQSAKILTKLFDLTLTGDAANQEAKADIVLPDGTVLLADAPVSFMLFLERRLTDLYTVWGKLPTLDPAEQWHHDPALGVYATDKILTTKSKKIPRTHVHYVPTDKHPAQVEMYHEDVIVGTWSTVKFSGAMPVDEKDALLERVEILREAVKYARQQANSIVIENREIGKAIFDYLLPE